MREAENATELALREGTSERLVRLSAKESHIFEDVRHIALVFRDGTPIEQIIVDRDIVRENHIKMLEDGKRTWDPSPFFSLAQERDLLEAVEEDY